ncbi:MAG: HD domain-containing protein, partial [Lachnospiraceae bacterium]|nr:HD domain-containing protein [Lachnospiraceae bacterium]
MTTYYGIMSALALINLIIFILFFKEKKFNYYFLGILAIVTISNAGNLVMAMSETLGEAYIAKKIHYIGACFIPPIILMVIFKMCKINVKKWMENVVIMYSFIIFSMVLTIGHSDIYYKSAKLTKIGDATALVPEYNIGHAFFYVLLYGYLLIGISVLFYSLKRKNTVSRKNLWALIGLEVVTIAVFLLGRIIAPSVEVTPLIFVIDGWFLLYLNRRVTVYSLEDNIISSLDKQDDYGYIMFDNKRNYLGANPLAEAILPELSMCKIDRPISNQTTLEFLQVELDELEEIDDSVFELDKDGQHYEGHINRIWYADKPVGYLFEIENATDRYKYTKLLAEYNDNLRDEVEAKTAHIKSIQSKLLFDMANIMENRDDNTGGHIKRTSDVVEILINTIKDNNVLKLDDRFCQAIIKAAPMHDLGKIAIGDNILRKPGRLTDEEFAIMQGHAAKSGELVESILGGVEEEYFVNLAKNVARHHHEKWNGAGYP